MGAIVRKELADYFNSPVRAGLMLLLVLAACLLALIASRQGIRAGGAEGAVFLRLFTTQINASSIGYFFVYNNFIALIFVPLIGIILGFDAMNRERVGGTLSRLVSQPIYRDSIINAKFVSGMIILTVLMTTTVLLVAGYGLRMIGVPPTGEEIIRLFVYMVYTVLYGAFWIGLAILFSVLFKNLAVSLLSSVAVWIFFSFIIFFLATSVAGSSQAFLIILRFSPSWLFGEATNVLLHPVYLETMTGALEAMSSGQAAYMLANPISLGQSLTLIWPYLSGLLALSAVCFGLSYVLFMKQEIRST